MIQEKKLLLQKHSREGAGKSQSYNYNEKPAPAVPSLISKSGYQDILTQSTRSIPKAKSEERFAN